MGKIIKMGFFVSVSKTCRINLDDLLYVITLFKSHFKITFFCTF